MAWLRSKKVSSPTRKPPAGQRACAGLSVLDPLTDARWGAFIAEHPRASIFHTVAWLDALRRTYGYKPIVYTTSAPGEDLRNGFVFCDVESWITGRRLVSLPFSDHCDPLTNSAEELDSILKYLQACSGLCNWKYIEVRPVRSLLHSRAREGFRSSKQYYQHTLDLRRPEPELFEQFHASSIQRRILRAERQGLTYERGQSDSLLAKFYQLILLTRRRHQIPPQPETWFRNLRDCMGDALEIHVASLKDRPVASILTLRFRNTVTYKYGGSDHHFHRTGAMPFLLWRALQAAKSGGVHTFDLGRSDSSNRGLVRFKDRWAAERTLLTYFRSPTKASRLSIAAKPVVRLARRFFEFLPAFMQQRAGRLLYRHIG